jgi:hypothetical protein
MKVFASTTNHVPIHHRQAPHRCFPPPMRGNRLAKGLTATLETNQVANASPRSAQYPCGQALFSIVAPLLLQTRSLKVRARCAQRRLQSLGLPERPVKPPDWGVYEAVGSRLVSQILLLLPIHIVRLTFADPSVVCSSTRVVSVQRAPHQPRPRPRANPHPNVHARASSTGSTARRVPSRKRPRPRPYDSRL